MSNCSHRIWVALLLVGACKSAPEAPPDTLPSSQPAQGSTQQASAPPALAQPRIYDEGTSLIETRVGERFEIALPANVTTPFKWSLAPESLGDVATLSAQTYSDAKPAGCERCVGYPGTAHFTLDAAQEGDTTLQFSYRGLGEKGEIKRELAIVLKVTP